MTEYSVKILDIEQLTHDVKRFRVEKPEGYTFKPGQATGVAINTPELKKSKRSFTFTGLNGDPHLEFTIKIYPEHNGLTKDLDTAVPGTELIIGSPWGAIAYKWKGVFIAGGAEVYQQAFSLAVRLYVSHVGVEAVGRNRLGHDQPRPDAFHEHEQDQGPGDEAQWQGGKAALPHPKFAPAMD